MAGDKLSLCASRTHLLRTATGVLEQQLHLRHRNGTVSDTSHWRDLFWRNTTGLSQDGASSPCGRTVSEVLLLPSALSFQLSRESCELLTPLLPKSLQETRSPVSEARAEDREHICLCGDVSGTQMFTSKTYQIKRSEEGCQQLSDEF